MNPPKYFPGRVIFDHLPKTAGMAVNAWLREKLGKGCVTRNLIGTHNDLIARYGGAYSVITAHVSFDGSTTDPRYRYVTCLRDPIDRIISFLYYLSLNLAGQKAAAELSHAARRFIESDGADVHPKLPWNHCVRHYASLEPAPLGEDSQLLERAVVALDRYDVWGLYEQLPLFINDFAALLGIPAPVSLNPVNVTLQRPPVSDISPTMRRRIESLNDLDMEFYAVAKSRYEKARLRWDRKGVVTGGWEPMPKPFRRDAGIAEFTLLSASIGGDVECPISAPLQFTAEFSTAIDVGKLDVGIEILDESGSVALQTSTNRLGVAYDKIAPGTYALRCDLMANFSEGTYTVGMRFDDQQDNPPRLLARYCEVVQFRATAASIGPITGYAQLSAAAAFSRIDDATVGIISDARGTIEPHADVGDLTVGERILLPVSISNHSAQDWLPTPWHPLVVEHRWRDADGTVLPTCGRQGHVFTGTIPAAGVVTEKLQLQAPREPGRYSLELCVERRHAMPFTSIGFQPCEMSVNVVPANAARRLMGTDVRLHCTTGRCREGLRSSHGEPGFLMFGPYIALAAGAWRAVLFGAFDGHRGIIRGDVCSAMGDVVHASHQITGWCDTIELHFHLDTPHDDVEVRIWVDGSASAGIRWLSIEPGSEVQTAASSRLSA